MATCLAFVLNSCNKEKDNLVKPKPKPEPPTTETKMSFPKKEMRAVWISTAWGLDWPIGVYGEAQQKQAYIKMLDKFKALNMNTIFFQVKAMGDAYYNSPYEPWASSITGTRGKVPTYDVMKFLIEEAHARGIEFHAWVNPYRIATRANAGSSYPNLHESIKPEWIVSHEKIQIYNPALPEVRTRLADIIKDLIVKYDVDGVHFDDYFYPDPSSAGQMVTDQGDYEKYGQGYSSIDAFRRGNVDKAIQGVYNVIVSTKPGVVFSISPAASKDYNYKTLYADIAKWCQEGWVDLLIPQLYQEIGNKSNDFQTNLASWSQFSYKAALVVGHGFYRFGDATAPSAFQSTLELDRQFDLTRRNVKVQGNAMYSAKYIMDNKILITDKLASIYKNPAVMPFIGRATVPAPVEVQNVKIENGLLKWTAPADGKSVVYYFPNLKSEGKVLAITKENSFTISENGFYSVSAVNSDSQESKPSLVLEKK